MAKRSISGLRPPILGRTNLRGPIGALVVCAALAGCASAPGTRDTGNDDPFEPLNRVVFNANDAVDTAVIRPMAEAYRAVFPQFVRDRIKAFVDNLQEPRIFANNLLQLRINDAGFTFARFYVNSTLGLLGLFDIASEHGLPKQTGDFGETLYVWGVDSGPYLVLPLFGPSNPRDLFGLGVDLHDATGAPPPGTQGSGSTWASTWSAASICVAQHRTLSRSGPCARLYAQFRSIVRQHREAQLRAARGLAEQPDDLVGPGDP
jgi:phospholipid-binding lipoprotein MlaA